MQQWASMSTLTRTIPKRISSVSRFIKRSNPQNNYRTCHRYSTKRNDNLRRPPGTALKSQVPAVSKQLRRGTHDAKSASGELENEPRSYPTSSIMKMDPKDSGQVFSPQHTTMHRVMIGVGSNIGDRVNMIEQACEQMLARGLNVRATSLLYETTPMYVTDQDSFYNGVCEVRRYPSPTRYEG